MNAVEIQSANDRTFFVSSFEKKERLYKIHCILVCESYPLEPNRLTRFRNSCQYIHENSQSLYNLSSQRAYTLTIGYLSTF